MGMHRPDETRRRLIGAIGALGAVAALGSVMRTPGAPPTSSTAPARPVVPDGATTSVSPVASTTAQRSTSSTSRAPSPPPAPVTVTVACRDAWGAQAATGGMEPHTPVRLTLHHTAVAQTSPSQGPARARRHQRHHQSLGWPDLAYHYLVDRTGLAYEGRDAAFRGDTGTAYDPTGHFLVCMEGDFDAQEPTPVQLSATVRLFAWASQEFGIDPGSLAGHGDYADISCPGESVAGLVASMAEAVAIAGPASIDRRCGVEGAALIAAIEAGDRSGPGG